MQHDKVNVSSFFQVSEILFYLTNLFIFIGLVQYTVRDMQNVMIPLGIADLVVIIIQVLLLILVFAGVINRNTAMAALLFLSIFLFQLSAVVNNNLGGNVDLQIAITTFISLLFASLAAFTVSKYMALGIGAVNLLFFIGTSLYYESARMMNDLVFFTTIILGYTIAMYYYRHSLESLAESLYDSYRLVKKQKIELELLKDKAEKINEVNRPFVVFGKNTSGLIHDFKNDLGTLGASGQLLKMKIRQNKAVTLEDIEDLEEHIGRIDSRVETIKYVVSASNHRDMEDIPLKRLINATLYPFRLTADLKNRIIFDELVHGEPEVRASRYRLVQILENLIRNSCEAIVDEQDRRQLFEIEDERADIPESIEEMLQNQERLGKVRVEARPVEAAVLLAIEDNGPGFSMCRDCESSNCIDCMEFEIGKTTKDYGSGLGLVSVIEAVSAMKGAMRISAVKPQGARVEILLPQEPSRPLSQEFVVSMGFSSRIRG
ncbi:ATP-binding protein [Salinispira pacifica]|nr:ATP-binding protein [Salinispira pacifica]